MIVIILIALTWLPTHQSQPPVLTNDLLHQAAASAPASFNRRQLLRQTKCGACQALFSELLLEALRHNLHEKGEEDILDSVEAACLGVVRNYTVTASPPWVVFSPESERMDHNEDMVATVRNAMVMKEACGLAGDDIGNEVSEGVWREIQRLLSAQTTMATPPSFDAQQSARRFCTALEESGCATKTKKKKKPKRKRKKTENSRNAQNTPNTPNAPNAPNTPNAPNAPKPPPKTTQTSTPSTPPTGAMAQYAEVLNNMDRDGSISRMLLQEQNDPSGMMSVTDKARFETATQQLQCSVCTALVDHVQTTEPKYILESEAELIPALEQICIGPVDTSVPVMLGIAPPPLPPFWTDKYYIKETKQKNWTLLSRTAKKRTKKNKNKNKKKKHKKKFLVARNTNIKEYRHSLSPEDYFEKIVLVATCKRVVQAKEDVMAEFIRERNVNKACAHVCGKEE